MIPAILLAPIAKRAIGVLGIVVALTAAYQVVWHRGYDAAELEHQAALAESLQRGLEQAQEIARQDAEVSEYYERLRTRTLTKVTEVTREIPASCQSCGIGPAGLRLINEARGYESPAADAPVQPDGGLPPATTDRNGQAPGFGRPLTHDQPRVFRLRGEAPLAGGAGQGAGGI